MRKFLIKPAIVGDLSWVKAGTDSLYGHIASRWQREGPKLTLAVTVPPNTTATVFVPARDASAVTESGTPASTARSVKFLRMEKDCAVFEVGAGEYRFSSVKQP